MKLTYKKRKKLKKKDFAIPEEAPGPGSYPIPDIAHGRNALARVSAFGTPTEERRVKRAVYRRFPSLSPRLTKRL